MEVNLDGHAFSHYVDVAFSSWDTLKQAVEAGHGGRDSMEKAKWLQEVVANFFAENRDLDYTEVVNFIAEIMDNEFDTIVDEDMSLKLSCRFLCQAYEFCNQKLNDERSKQFLESYENLKDKANHAVLQNAIHSPSSSECSSSSEEDDVSNVVDNDILKNNQNPKNEPDEDGWITVTKKR